MEFRNGSTPPKNPVAMRSTSFSTSTPKPRAEGSSPSAPAKESRRSNCFFGFLLWAKMALNCGTRSVRRGAGALWAPFSADRAGRRAKSLLAQFWALFSHLASSVPTVSVWYIIKRASIFGGVFLHWTCSGKNSREKNLLLLCFATQDLRSETGASCNLRPDFQISHRPPNLPNTAYWKTWLFSKPDRLCRTM